MVWEEVQEGVQEGGGDGVQKFRWNEQLEAPDTFKFRNPDKTEAVDKRALRNAKGSSWQSIGETSPSNAGVAGLITSWGARIPHASQPKKTKHRSRNNIVTS